MRNRRNPLEMLDPAKSAVISRDQALATSVAWMAVGGHAAALPTAQTLVTWGALLLSAAVLGVALLAGRAKWSGWMKKVVGGAKVALFVVLSLTFFLALSFLLSLVWEKVPGDPATIKPKVWYLVLLPVAMWIAAMFFWPEEPGPDASLADEVAAVLEKPCKEIAERVARAEATAIAEDLKAEVETMVAKVVEQNATGRAADPASS